MEFNIICVPILNCIFHARLGASCIVLTAFVQETKPKDAEVDAKKGKPVKAVTDQSNGDVGMENGKHFVPAICN